MRKVTERQIIDLLLSKYRADPEGFRAYLPEVSRVLEVLRPSSRPVSKSPFGLTDRERMHHQQRLHELLNRTDPLSHDQAVRALEHWATLVMDDNLPADAQTKHLMAILKPVIGKAPGSFKAVSRAQVKEDQGEKAFTDVSVMRGVLLSFDRNMQLLSVLVNPRKVRERRKLLSLVGAGSDPFPDVAALHDDYLTECTGDASG